MHGTLRIAASIATILIGAAITGCGDDDSSTGPNGGAGDVSGRVALQKTGAGVPNALVALIRDGVIVQAVGTDDAGAFAFRAVPAGRYVIRLTGLELTGLSMLHYSFDPVQDTVDVAGSPVDVIFAGVALVPARIDGGVYCDGQPVPEATVRVVGGAADREASTNAQGEFGVTDLDPGHYAVILTGGPGPCTVGPEYRVVELRRGQEFNVEFSVTP